MKKLFLWLILAIPVTVFGQFAPDTVTWPYILTIDELKSVNIYKKFIRFIDHVEESRVRIDTTKEVHIAILPVSKESPFSVGGAWSMRLEGENNFAICITKSLLAESNNLWLENIAQHEICHIMLGHQDHGNLQNIEDQYLFEVEATACTQQYLGKEKTIPFLAESFFRNITKTKEEALESSREYAKVLAGIR